MSEIDWSKAPEGATHFYKCGNMFLKVEGDGMVSYLRTDGVWEHNRCHVDSYGGYLIPRPPDWSGDGLPPVGTVCEYYADEDTWRRCEIIAHKDGKAVAWVNHAHIWASSGAFLRPIRTPEQIAAEERNKAIRAIELHILKAQEQYLSVVQTAQSIYDAGFQVPKQ